jgi:hypothetical protein
MHFAVSLALQASISIDRSRSFHAKELDAPQIAQILVCILDADLSR